MIPIWLRRGDDLSESEERWMSYLSRMRVLRFGRIPTDGAEWVRQIEECAAEVKAERGAKAETPPDILAKHGIERVAA